MSIFIRIRILTCIPTSTGMEIWFIPTNTATYTIMNIFMHMLTPIHTRVTREIIPIAMKANTDRMITSTLTMTESFMTTSNKEMAISSGLNRYDSVVGKGLIGAQI